jgi:hypothetical protein
LFFTGILPRLDQISGFLEKKILKFFLNFFFEIFFHILECNSFSPEFYRNRTKIQGFQFHIQGCGFFFTRILPQWDQNSGVSVSNTRVFLFHQNFPASGPKFRVFNFTYMCVFLFYQNFNPDGTKFQGF